MQTSEQGEELAHHQKQHIHLRVRYLASSKLFHRADAPRHETLGELKPVVMHFFGLTEGQVDGGRKEYEFAKGEDVLTNLSVTLGHLAGDHNELELKLLEKFVQG